MRVLVLALLVSSGCWGHHRATPGSSASWGTGAELVLPPELGEAARLRVLISDLPVIAYVDRGPTPIVIRGRVTAADIPGLVTEVELVHADVSRRLLAPRTTRHPPVDLVLYEDDVEYQAIALGYARVPAGQGFYRPDARVAAVNLARGRGNLRHELVHPLIVDDFPLIPAWLNEGIASLYGGARLDRGRLRFEVDARVRDLHAAMAEDRLPGRRRVALADRPELYGRDGATYYAVSQHVVLYLQRTGQLARYYRTGRADPTRRAAALAAAIDWRRFERWAWRLRAGAPPPPP